MPKDTDILVRATAIEAQLQTYSKLESTKLKELSSSLELDLAKLGELKELSDPDVVAKISDIEAHTKEIAKRVKSCDKEVTGYGKKLDSFYQRAGKAQVGIDKLKATKPSKNLDVAAGKIHGVQTLIDQQKKELDGLKTHIDSAKSLIALVLKNITRHKFPEQIRKLCKSATKLASDSQNVMSAVSSMPQRINQQRPSIEELRSAARHIIDITESALNLCATRTGASNDADLKTGASKAKLVIK